MTWIKVVEEDEATGHIGEYYEKARQEGRRVSNIHKASSLNPLAMEAIDLFNSPGGSTERWSPGTPKWRPWSPPR